MKAGDIVKPQAGINAISGVNVQHVVSARVAEIKNSESILVEVLEGYAYWTTSSTRMHTFWTDPNCWDLVRQTTTSIMRIMALSAN